VKRTCVGQVEGALQPVRRASGFGSGVLPPLGIEGPWRTLGPRACIATYPSATSTGRTWIPVRAVHSPASGCAFRTRDSPNSVPPTWPRFIAPAHPQNRTGRPSSPPSDERGPRPRHRRDEPETAGRGHGRLETRSGQAASSRKMDPRPEGPDLVADLSDEKPCGNLASWRRARPTKSRS